MTYSYKCRSRDKIIGHRGACAYCPENTLSSFNQAIKFGLNWIECDTRLSSCNQWVIIHDETVERTSNGKGQVSQLKLSELKSLDMGTWFHKNFNNEKILTLPELVSYCASMQVSINLEVKVHEKDRELYIDKIVEFLRNKPSTTNILLSSFDLPFLKAVRERLPFQSIGYLVKQIELDTFDIVEQNSFNSLNCCSNKITSKDIKKALSYRIPLFLYTINDPDKARYFPTSALKYITP